MTLRTLKIFIKTLEMQGKISDETNISIISAPNGIILPAKVEISNAFGETKLIFDARRS